MSNKIVLWVVVGVVVVGGILALSMKMSPPGVGTENEIASETSLKDLIASNDPQKCTMTSKNNLSETSGIIYIASGKMSGEFTAVTNGQSMKTHMIVKDDTTYVWNDATTQGFRMAFGDTPTSNETEQMIDVNQKYGYDCDDWSADESVFALPASVNFISAAELMGGANIPGGTMPPYDPN